jgi:hypothetical protein
MGSIKFGFRWLPPRVGGWGRGGGSEYARSEVAEVLLAALK